MLKSKMSIFNKIFLIVLLSFSFVKGKNIEYKVEEVISNLNVPWGMAFLNDKEMIINQKNGWVFILNIETKKLTPSKWSRY